MTASTAPDRETLQRAGLLFNGDQALHWDEAVERAAVELVGERAEQAERDARSRESAESFESQMACPTPACGGNTLGTGTGLCPECSRTARLVERKRDELVAAEMLNGRSRLEWVADWVTRRDGRT